MNLHDLGDHPGLRTGMQNVLKDLLYKKARSLTSGITYSSFVQAHGRKEPEIDALQAAINAKKGAK